MLAEIFKQEYSTQLEYQKDLKDWGVSLPEEFQSTDYADMVLKSGDDDTIDLLKDLTMEAQKNRKYLGNYITAYKQGEKQGDQLEAYANILPNEDIPYSEYTFQADEFDMLKDQGIFSEYGVGANMLTGSTSDAFKQGFFAGSRDQDEAIEYSKKLFPVLPN